MAVRTTAFGWAAVLALGLAACAGGPVQVGPGDTPGGRDADVDRAEDGIAPDALQDRDAPDLPALPDLSDVATETAGPGDATDADDLPEAPEVPETTQGDLPHLDPSAADTSPDPAVDTPADPSPDPAVDAPADPGSEVPGPQCTANNDGVLAAGEVPVLLGAAVRYVVRSGDPAPIPDLAGSPCPAGLCWDFSAAVAGDVEEVDLVKPASAWWFGEGFPDDAFAVNLQPGMMAVYRKTDEALWMIGMASEAEGDDRVRLAYDPPVPILRLPLQKDDAYEVETQATGRYDGYDYPLDYGLMGTVRVFHRYRFLANGEGQVKVPLGTFHAVRLVLDLRMEVRNSLGATPLATQRFKVYDFLAECVGLVARVRSREGEAATFFTEATEYRRLGF